MRMNFYKFFLVLLLLLGVTLIESCSSKNEQTLQEMDKFYRFGECENPHRKLTPVEKQNCIAKKMGGGEGAFDLNLGNIFGNKDKEQNQSALISSVNSKLWNGALEVLRPYSLNKVDSIGGYIETDWIVNENELNKRCLIKIQISSAEVVSNGVNALLLCQKLTNDIWVNDGVDYLEESQNLTIAVLNKSTNY